MRTALFLTCLMTVTIVASDRYPAPRFTQPDRVQRLTAAMPQIDRLFEAYATEKKIPGMVWGVVIDDRLAHVGAFGVRDRASGARADADTGFRIASMTKSFTALAVLKLRDEGKLSLEDPVSRWIPAFTRMERPTADTPPLTVRQLLSHSAGFPEDNPWGDQQLAATDAMMDEWLVRGIPFSTAPGTRYEYSNYAYGLLGRVVTAASGTPYEQFVRREILAPLKMDASTFEFSDVPAERRAIGYRLEPNGTFSEEAPLPHGVFGAMGGLLTTANDMGRYVAFQLSAWPPRDEAEAGPVNRASVREMAQMWTPANLASQVRDGKSQASMSGYGFGLRVSMDCRFGHIVAHGGGLPGFGSHMVWLPEYGVGIFSMTTLTYSGPGDTASDAFNALLQTGALRKRDWTPTARQVEIAGRLRRMWDRWDEADVREYAAMNFFLDAPSPEREAELAALKRDVGACTTAGPFRAENWMRGQFNLTCERGTVGVFFTLAPTEPAALQHLSFRKLASPDEQMGAPTGAPAGVSCK